MFGKDKRLLNSETGNGQGTLINFCHRLIITTFSAKCRWNIRHERDTLIYILLLFSYRNVLIVKIFGTGIRSKIERYLISSIGKINTPLGLL